MEQSLENALNPKSIAIIGASEVPGKAAERRTRSLIEGGYKGRIFPINPKRDTIFSLKAYPSVLEVPESVDLAVVIIPPKFIPGAVSDCVKKGVKGVVIITAGLGETGEAGKQIEKDILNTAKAGGAHVIGPNCSGMFSAAMDMNFLGIPNINKGPYSVIAQSGNVIDSLSHYAKLRDTGFSKIISAGNAVGVQLHEYLLCLKNDPDTKVIMLYLEGIKEGAALIQAAKETVKSKPIVALKVGRTGAGVRGRGFPYRVPSGGRQHRQRGLHPGGSDPGVQRGRDVRYGRSIERMPADEGKTHRDSVRRRGRQRHRRGQRAAVRPRRAAVLPGSSGKDPAVHPSGHARVESRGLRRYSGREPAQ